MQRSPELLRAPRGQDWRISNYLSLLAVAAVAAPLASAVGADDHTDGPAVSGFNTKFSAEGGEYDDEGAGLAQGSLTTPLGHAFGFQLDGALGTIDGETALSR